MKDEMSFVPMDNNDTPRFCITPRFGIASWGYSKIIINIILLITTAERMVDVFGSPYFYDIVVILIFVLLAALAIADIVFQSKLIHGLRKNKMDHLIAYCKYTKVLWVLMPMSFVVYMFIWVTGISGPSFWHYDRDNRVLTIMCTMLITTILQSVIMLLVIKEIKHPKGETDEVSKSSCGIRLFGITIKIETSGSEDVKEEDKINTHIEDTNEKAKLTA